MSRLPLYLVNDTTLVFAFRYALGRQSTAPGHMVAELKKHWSRLQSWTQFQIQREISQAIARKEAGWPSDVETWREVLSWKPRAKPGYQPTDGNAHDDGEACDCT